MKNVKRKRNISVTFRMNEKEYTDFQDRIAKSGITKQAYMIGAVLGATITSSEEVYVLRDISLALAGYEKQLRGLATNVNQMACIANGQGVIPSEKQLVSISSLLQDIRNGSDSIWRLIRQSIRQQRATEL